MPKQKQSQKPDRAREEPGPGRSTSEAALNDLRRQIAQRNEQASQEGSQTSSGTRAGATAQAPRTRLIENTVSHPTGIGPELSPRDRSLITLAGLIATGSTEQLRGHLARAQSNDLTAIELKGGHHPPRVLRRLAKGDVRLPGRKASPWRLTVKQNGPPERRPTITTTALVATARSRDQRHERASRRPSAEPAPTARPRPSAALGLPTFGGLNGTVRRAGDDVRADDRASKLPPKAAWPALKQRGPVRSGRKRMAGHDTRSADATSISSATPTSLPSAGSAPRRGWRLSHLKSPLGRKRRPALGIAVVDM